MYITWFLVVMNKIASANIQILKYNEVKINKLVKCLLLQKKLIDIFSSKRAKINYFTTHCLKPFLFR